MVCLLFVAGHDDLLEREIDADTSGEYGNLRGVPKALLPATRGGERRKGGTRVRAAARLERERRRVRRAGRDGRRDALLLGPERGALMLYRSEV